MRRVARGVRGSVRGDTGHHALFHGADTLVTAVGVYHPSAAHTHTTHTVGARRVLFL